MISQQEQQETYSFYDSISLDDFLKAAERAGLKNKPDMEKIAPYLKNAKRVLDLGAGYGRCLEFLVDNFNGEIYAVEFSHKLAEFLKERFSPRVKVYEQDMRNLNIEGSFDIVLSNWGAVNNLNFEEQLQLLCNLRLITTKSGIIFFETRRGLLRNYSKDKNKQNSRFTHKGTNKFFMGYVTSKEEFGEMARKSGYKLSISEYDILLGQGRIKERVLYMFEKY